MYPDPEGTATLAATRLPGVHAAAGMARLTAIARAMKSAGMGGGLDFLRSVALIGLLLGTLPLVPPPAGDPGPSRPHRPRPWPARLLTLAILATALARAILALAT